MSTTPRYSDQLSSVSAIYNVYRILLPLILLTTYSGSNPNSEIGSVNGTLFVVTCTAYAFFAVALALFAPRGTKVATQQPKMITALLLDLLAIGLMVYCSGGTISGLSVLFMVPISAGSILLRSRIRTFLAALAVVAAITIIYIEVYLSISIENPPNQFTQSGTLGAVFVGIVWYFSVCAICQR